MLFVSLRPRFCVGTANPMEMMLHIRAGVIPSVSGPLDRHLDRAETSYQQTDRVKVAALFLIVLAESWRCLCNTFSLSLGLSDVFLPGEEHMSVWSRDSLRVEHVKYLMANTQKHSDGKK
ncbi:hypothetical protein RRG08_036242 [Elysia crispata]|uniref:Uncharacterized protein n=1 Tax=Elysia crispata TaxID=231223 RepID=A0AAE1CEW9_9GAST|nr:hypothetical protein RRG08_036242 [Elysia crispata]